MSRQNSSFFFKQLLLICLVWATFSACDNNVSTTPSPTPSTTPNSSVATNVGPVQKLLIDDMSHFVDKYAGKFCIADIQAA